MLEDECCLICERVQFGHIQVLPFNHWRHEDCCIGSEEWKIYYQRHRLSTNLTLKEFYNLFKCVYEA